jgi:hypothetical protein
MATDFPVGSWDASQVDFSINGYVLTKHRQGIHIADPYVKNARLRLALVNGNYRIPASLPAPTTGLEIAKGSVVDHAAKRVTGVNSAVDTAYEDVWGAGGIMTYPVAGEQWEVVSSSANDAAAGTGARTVVITYLDGDYVEQTETVTLNGATPVATVATDMLRPVSMNCVTWGTTAGNAGTLTLRVAGAGNTRSVVLNDGSVSLNSSAGGRYTTPAGVTSYVMGMMVSSSKAQDVLVRLMVREFGLSGFQVADTIASFRGAAYYDLSGSPIQLPEKTDAKLIAKSSGTAAVVSVSMSVLEITN